MPLAVVCLAALRLPSWCLARDCAAAQGANTFDNLQTIVILYNSCLAHILELYQTQIHRFICHNFLSGLFAFSSLLTTSARLPTFSFGAVASITLTPRSPARPTTNNVLRACLAWFHPLHHSLSLVTRATQHPRQHPRLAELQITAIAALFSLHLHFFSIGPRRPRTIPEPTPRLVHPRKRRLICHHGVKICDPEPDARGAQP